MQFADLDVSRRHDVGASHVPRKRRLGSRLTDLEEVQGETLGAGGQADRQRMAARIFDLIHQLGRWTVES